MDRQLWLRFAQELEDLLEREPAERAERLESLANEDPELVRLVRDALAADEASIPLLDEALVLGLDEAGLEPGESRPTLDAGVRVGAWKLLERLGRGGMGEVWLAERDDGQYRLQVAIKLIDGVLDSELLREQLRRERQILAGLDHPNIARLVDGGVRDNGMPWYAMEFVAGVPLNRYCSEAGLNIDARMRLVARVARAVQHAHGRLVVHRDLKPHNILVDQRGEPHLLDFGIAKLLEEAGGDAGAVTLLGASTPDYAAPEQRHGRNVGTAADIYALGVIAYELLTGGLPSRAERVGNEETRGPLPSQASGIKRKTRAALAGDLDALVSQALAPDPHARYVSADALADDIDRFLEDRPVLARRAGAGYRARKFVRRHWLGVGLGTGAVVALCLALGVSLVQTQRAERALARANAVQEFLIGVFDAAEPGNYEAGLVVPRRDLAERAAERLNIVLEHQPEARIDLLIAIGRVLRQLGFADRARPLLQQAVDELDAQGASGSDARAVSALFELGQIESLDERMEAAGQAFERADAIAMTVGESPVARAAILFQLGIALSDVHRFEAALSAFERAAGLANDRDGSRALLPRIRLLTALTLNRAGRVDESLSAGEQAVADARTILGPRHERTASALSTVGGMLRRAGRLDRAEAMLREAVGIGRDAYGHADSAALNNLAGLVSDLGRHAAAERHYAQALELATARYGAEAAATARYRRNLGMCQAWAGRLDAGLGNLESAWRSHVDATAPTHRYSVFIQAQLAWMLRRAGREGRARALLAELRDRLPDLRTEYPRAAIRIEMVSAGLAMDSGRAEQALARIEAAEAMLQDRATRTPLDNHEQVELALLAGDVRAAAGQADAARADWLAARELARQLLGGEHPLRAEVESRLRIEAPLPVE
ncbi:MAG TPA: serine/threonine-protein kinase [Wenzhouxiangellaceae bacterium]|nr:serine/threonine-protein kinase [Wenzhouxiangellaceae bacterium]